MTATVGSGFLGLNPAVVAAEIAVSDDQGTDLTVYGTAKEGLIKQHAGERSARRTAELLNQCFNSSRETGQREV